MPNEKQGPKLGPGFTKVSEWKAAMDDEIQPIQKNCTWTLTHLLVEKQPVGLKWIFKSKYHVDGSLLKRKTYLVAKGYSQKFGIDYEEVFSLVVRMESVLVFVVIAAQNKWPLLHLDVKSAFPNGNLTEENYVC